MIVFVIIFLLLLFLLTVNRYRTLRGINDLFIFFGFRVTRVSYDNALLISTTAYAHFLNATTKLSCLSPREN